MADLRRPNATGRSGERVVRESPSATPRAQARGYAAYDVQPHRPQCENHVELVESEVQSTLSADPRLSRLRRFAEQNLETALSLAQAAEVVGLERTYFSRYFSNSTGWTFSEWNRAIRVERAAVLLNDRHLRVSSVGLVVGYGDLTTFERAFKKCVGTPPSVYRKACDTCGCLNPSVRKAEYR